MPDNKKPKTYKEVQAEINAKLEEKKLRQERIQTAIDHIKQDPKRFEKLKTFVDSKIGGSTDHHGYCIGSACYSLNEAKEILSYTSGTKLQDDIVSGKLKGYNYDYNLNNIEKGDILQLNRRAKTGKRGAPYHNMLVENVVKDNSGKVKNITYFGSQGTAESFNSHDLDSTWINDKKKDKNYQIIKKEFVSNSLLKERDKLKPAESNIIRRDIDYVPNEQIKYLGSSDESDEKKKNRKDYVDAMMSKKQQLMKAYNLSNNEFNNLVGLSAGIIDQESEFGTSTRYNLKQIPGVQFTGKILKGNFGEAFDSGQYSKGAGQIKEDYFPKKAGSKFGINPESKESTLLTVLDRYTTQVPSELRGKSAGYLKTVNSYKGMKSDTNEYAKTVLDKASSYGLSDYTSSKEDLNKYKTEKITKQQETMRDAFNINQDGTMKSNNYKSVSALKKSKGGTVKKYALAGTIPPIDALNTAGAAGATGAAGKFKNYFKSDAGKSDIKSIIQGLPSLTDENQQQTSQDPNAPVKKSTGKTIGGIAGGIAGLALAPFTGGISTVVGPALGSMIGGGIDNVQYKNKTKDYNDQQNAMTSNIAGNFNPNAQTKQFKKGGELIKRADGSYSQRGLWDNIRANKGSGKAPTKEMLKQEKKIKANMAHGGIDTSNSMSGPKYAKGGFDANNPAMGNTTQYAPDAEFFTNSEAPASASNFAVDYGSRRSPAQTQTQSKQKPAINVTDPNDPRLKAYNDSLNLNKNYTNQINSLREELKSDNQQLKTKGSIPFQRFEFRNNYMNDPIKPSQIMYFDNGIENFEDYYYWEFPYYKAPVQPYKLVSPSITNKPTTPKSNNLVKPAPRETLNKMPISPIKKLDTNSIQAQPNLQTKEIPTTPSSNIKDQRTYTASKMLGKMNKPTGYINEGMNEGRQEITKSKGGVVKKYVKGGMLKPMGNDMYEVKSYKKGTDKVEYRPNVFIDNKEIIRKNPDGSTQILSDDLGYAKVAKNIARAKGGNITDNQFDQLYMNQEMSKASKGKGNKYVEGGTDKKLKLRNPMSDDRATLVSGNFDSFGVGNPKIEPMKSKSLAPMSIDKVNPKPFLVSPTGPKNVKDFQDWLDVNQPNWYKGKKFSENPDYKNYYGTYGSNTTAAYKKYGNDYENMMMDQQRKKDLDLKPMPRIGQNPKQLNPELAGKIEEVPSMPTSKPLDKPGNKSLDTKVNPLGYLSTLPSAAYDIAQGLKGGDPVDFERMNTKYQFADPRGAMAAASRGVTSAYNAAKNAAKTTTTSAGEYLANMGNLASKEGMEKASALTAIKAQYDMANTQGLNQTNLAKDQYNAQVQMRESIARQEEQDAARSSISKGLAGLSQNTMSYMSDVNANKTQGRFVDLINSGKYEYVEEIDADGKPRIKLVPKKGAESNSVQVTPSPTKQTEPASK
jgi:hypothetical protein